MIRCNWPFTRGVMIIDNFEGTIPLAINLDILNNALLQFAENNLNKTTVIKTCAVDAFLCNIFTAQVT